MITRDRRLAEELAYCVPLGLPHSEFLSWEEDDQDKAIAYLRDKALACNSCGTRESEWEGDSFAFVVSSRVCKGCELIELERDGEQKHIKGEKIFLVPREVELARIAELDPSKDSWEV